MEIYKLIILGISDSIESHACIVKDGKLLSFISEERLSRKKADAGYPKKSIEKVLKIANISKSEIDFVALAGFDNGTFQSLYKPGANFSVQDWITQNNLYWEPKLLKNKKLNELDDFLIWEKKFKEIKKDPYYKFAKLAKNTNKKFHIEIFNKIRLETISRQLKIDKKKIFTFRHEDCHKYYGLFSQISKKNKNLIITIEGGGDDSSATISTSKNDKIIEKYKTNDAMLGRLYRYITLLLGMKPGQHEYKVMGLAPYGTRYHGQKSLDYFKSFNYVKGIRLIKNKKYKEIYFTSKKELEGQRFDGIAWGLQQYTEIFLKKWVINCIKKFKIKDIILSGGVAQNIKAVKFLAEQKEIKSIWSGPISGDGSLAIGAAWMASKKFKPKIKVLGLETVYLGSKIEDKDIKKIIKSKCKKFHISKNPSNKKIAKLISEGHIIARCKGRMEFGQRALGNRSILADPRSHYTVEKINTQIKYRDFWMPFTPSILFEYVNKILINPKKIYSPYMTMAFDIKKDFIERIPAVIHSADKTTRPQMLKKETNPDYYDLINQFKKITGIPLLLNTSFNLHGDAIVENAHQAINTFINSDLDALILNDYLISSKKINK